MHPLAEGLEFKVGGLAGLYRHRDLRRFGPRTLGLQIVISEDTGIYRDIVPKMENQLEKTWNMAWRVELYRLRRAQGLRHLP